MSNSIALLRKVLLIDCVTCVAAGLLMALFAEPLSEPLGLGVPFLRAAGLSLLPFAAFLAHAAQRPEPSRREVGVVIALNVVWVVDSVLVLLTGWVEPTLLGTAFVLAQALAVGVLADLELVGIRRLAARELAAR